MGHNDRGYKNKRCHDAICCAKICPIFIGQKRDMSGTCGTKTGQAKIRARCYEKKILYPTFFNFESGKTLYSRHAKNLCSP